MNNKILITQAIIQKLEIIPGNEQFVALYEAYLKNLIKSEHDKDPLGLEDLSEKAKQHYLRSIGVR